LTSQSSGAPGQGWPVVVRMLAATGMIGALAFCYARQDGGLLLRKP